MLCPEHEKHKTIVYCILDIQRSLEEAVKHLDEIDSRECTQRKDDGSENGICTPIVPLFCKTAGLSIGLSSIKMNMICGERSSFGDFYTYVKLSV